MPTSRAIWPNCVQVMLCQMPKSFWRRLTCVAALGDAAPEHRRDGVGGRFGRRHRQSFLRLPSPRSPRARRPSCRDRTRGCLPSRQACAGIFHHDAADFQHIAEIRDLQRHVGVLLDQQDGHAALAVDAHHDIENFPGELGRQARGSARPSGSACGLRQQRARDRQHLLLAAGELAGLLLGALAQDREIAEHGLEVARDAVRSLRV